MTTNYEASVLFTRNYASTAHVVINQGGTSSGKTYAIEQVLFCLASENEKQIITVVGQDIPNLKAGALRDALNIYNNSAQLQVLVKTYNKTDRIFEFHNGTVVSWKVLCFIWPSIHTYFDKQFTHDFDKLLPWQKSSHPYCFTAF